MKASKVSALWRALCMALVIAVPASAVVSACATDGYYGYAGPAYVIGHYACVNPLSGRLDYCVEYSDGTSSLVPWSIYSTVLFGQYLTVSHSVWTVHTVTGIHVHVVPDVYHVRYRAARVYPSVTVAQRVATQRYRTSSGTVYGGMSYRNESGQVVYRSPSGTPYRSSSGGTSVYRSSSSGFSSGRRR